MMKPPGTSQKAIFRKNGIFQPFLLQKCSFEHVTQNNQKKTFGENWLKKC